MSEVEEAQAGLPANEPDYSYLDIEEPEEVEIPSGEHEDAGDDDSTGGALPTVAADILDRARNAGMSDEDIHSFAGDEALLIALDMIDRANDNTRGGKPDLESGDIATEIVDEDQNQSDLQNEINQLRRELAELKDTDSEKKFTEMIGGLVGFDEVLGSGSELTRVQQANRKSIKSSMEVIASGFRKSGKKISEEQAFDMAVAGQFGNVHKTIARQNLEDKVQDRQSKMTHPPTPRKTTKALSSQKQLEIKLGEMMRDKGMLDEQVLAEDDPGFL
jgi:hypothetical protein